MYSIKTDTICSSYSKNINLVLVYDSNSTDSYLLLWYVEYLVLVNDSNSTNSYLLLWYVECFVF